MFTEVFRFLTNTRKMSFSPLHFYPPHPPPPFQCYLSWVQSYTECVLRAHQTEAAVCHRSHKLLSRSLGAWLRYLEHRRTKLLLSFQARERHSRTLLRHCFCHWMQRYAMAKRLAEFEEAVCEMAALARRRRAFTRWKYCIFPV